MKATLAYAGPSEHGPSLADWAEALVCMEGSNAVPRSILRDKLSNSGAGDEDLSVDLLMNEVDARSKVAPTVYPFRDEDGILSLIEEMDRSMYECLLWLSLPDTDFRIRKAWSEIEPWYDEIVMAAAARYIGGGCKALRFGYPPSGERPAKFPKALDWLSGHLGIDRGKEKGHGNNKDGGADVIVWHPFADGLPGFVTLIVQATVRGRWEAKVGDLQTRRWNGWIDFGMDPTTALAIPFALAPDHPRLSEVRREVTIIFDRLRLCEFLMDAEEPLKESAREWTDKERAAALSPSKPGPALVRKKKAKKTTGKKTTGKKTTGK